jgi:hypothetical protein
MKKIVRLTERDLSRIVKRVINEQEENDEEEGNDNVRKLVSLLVDNGLVDKEKMNIYDYYIEVYGIEGWDFGYFEENFIILYPGNIDEGIVNVKGEDYGESIDDEEYDEVINHIWSDWEEKLNIEFID